MPYTIHPISVGDKINISRYNIDHIVDKVISIYINYDQGCFTCVQLLRSNGAWYLQDESEWFVGGWANSGGGITPLREITDDTAEAYAEKLKAQYSSKPQSPARQDRQRAAGEPHKAADNPTRGSATGSPGNRFNREKTEAQPERKPIPEPDKKIPEPDKKPAESMHARPAPVKQAPQAAGDPDAWFTREINGRFLKSAQQLKPE